MSVPKFDLKTLDLIPFPILIINRLFEVVSKNAAALNLFGEATIVTQRVGVNMNCEIAIKEGDCHIGQECKKCALGSSLDTVFETGATIENKAGIVTSTVDGSTNEWHLIFGISKYDDNHALLTISNHNKQLVVSDQTSEKAIQYAPNAIIELDAKGTIQSINEKACKTLYFKPDEVINKNIVDANIYTNFHEDYAYFKYHVDIFEEKPFYQLYAIFARKDLTSVQVLCKIEHTIEGKVILSFNQQINTKGVFYHLAMREARIKHLLNKIEEGIVVINEKAELISANSIAQDLLGLEEHTFYFKPMQSAIRFNCEDNCSDLKELINNIPIKIESTKTFSEVRINNTVKNEILTLDFTVIPSKSINNLADGALIIIKNKTSYKALINETEALHKAITNSPDQVFFVNNQGVIVYANQSARQVSLNQNFGREHTHHIAHIQANWNKRAWKNLLKKTIEKGHHEYNSILLNTEGESYPANINVTLIEKDHQKLFSFFVKDITNLTKNQERILRELKINKSFAEIGKELTQHDSFRSVTLLVRQYALDLTSSNFGFVVYEDPIEQKLVFSIYSDKATQYKSETEIAYNIIIGAGHKKGIITKTGTDYFNSLDELKPIAFKEFRAMHFTNMAWKQIVYNNEIKGAIFVAGKKELYNEQDSFRLENLSNLFGLAIYRIQSHIELSKSKEMLGLAITSSRIILSELDLKLGEVSVNQNWFDITEIDKDDFNPQLNEFFKTIHPSDRLEFANKILDLQQEDNANGFLFRVKHNNGRYLWMKVIGKVIEKDASNKSKRILWLQIDVTEEHFLNERLRSAKEDAESASKAKSAFLARMSHEIRTPINSSIGFAELLEKRLEPGVEMDYLKNIKKSSHDLLNIINDILDFSKLEALKIQLQKRPVNISELFTEVVQNFSTLFEDKGLKHELVLEPSFPRSILADDFRIKQILVNLISNAIKFTDKGKITIGLSIINRSTDSADFAFYVNDTGIGIRQEAQQKIFNDFYQQEDQDNRKYGGTGLGLGIVKRLLTLMNGRIELESEVGVGTTFTAFIPDAKIILRNDQHELDEALNIVIICPDKQHIIDEIQHLMDQKGFGSQVLTLNQYLGHKNFAANYDVTVLTYHEDDENYHTKLLTLNSELSQLRIPLITITNTPEQLEKEINQGNMYTIGEENIVQELSTTIEKANSVTIGSTQSTQLEETPVQLSAVQLQDLKDLVEEEWPEILKYKSFKKVIAMAEKLEEKSKEINSLQTEQLALLLKQHASFFNIEEMTKVLIKLDHVLFPKK